MAFFDFFILTAYYLVGIVVVLVFTLLNCAYLTYYERKVMGRMQQRVGPMHTGPHGILQPLVLRQVDVHLAHDDNPYPSDVPITRANGNQFTCVLVIGSLPR